MSSHFPAFFIMQNDEADDTGRRAEDRLKTTPSYIALFSKPPDNLMDQCAFRLIFTL
jgi:hypothetical protein